MLPYAREWTLLTAGWCGRRKQKLTNSPTRITKHHIWCGYILWRTPGGFSSEFVVGVCHQVLQILTLFHKFVPRALFLAVEGGRPTSKAGEKRPGDEVVYFRPKNCHYPHPFLDLASKIHVLFRPGVGRNYAIITELDQNANKKISNSHYSLLLIRLELKQQIRSCIPSKTMPESSNQNRPSRPKRRKNHKLWGGTYLLGKNKGVPSEANSTFCVINQYN